MQGALLKQRGAAQATGAVDRENLSLVLQSLLQRSLVEGHHLLVLQDLQSHLQLVLERSLVGSHHHHRLVDHVVHDLPVHLLQRVNARSQDQAHHPL